MVAAHVKEQEEIDHYIHQALTDHARPNAIRLKAAIRILMTTDLETFKKTCSKDVQSDINDLTELLYHPEKFAPQLCASEEGKKNIIQHIKKYTLDHLYLLDERLQILPNTNMVVRVVENKERLKSVIHTTAIHNVVSAAHYVDRIELSFRELGYTDPLLNELVKQASEAMVRLHDAVLAGDSFRVRKELIIPGVDVNLTNGDGLSVLYIAARENYVNIVKLLLELPKINVNLANNNGWTALHIAARMGHTEVVKLLLKVFSINVNVVNSDGWTPLHWASWHGHTEIVTLLINFPGILLNLVEQSNSTALHWAARNGQGDIVKIFVNQSLVEVNPIDFEFKTPLYYAVQFDHLNATLGLLKSAKIDVNIADMDGLTPLHWAARNGQIEFVKALLTAPNIRLDLLDHNQMTASDWAERNEFYDLVPILSGHLKFAWFYSLKAKIQRYLKLSFT